MQGINNLFNSMKQIFECNYMYMYSIYTNSFNNITSSTISWIFYSHQPLLVSFWFCYPWRNYHNHWDTPRGELPRACRERIISYLSQAQWKVGSYSKVTKVLLLQFFLQTWKGQFVSCLIQHRHRHKKTRWLQGFSTFLRLPTLSSFLSSSCLRSRNSSCVNVSATQKKRVWMPKNMQSPSIINFMIVKSLACGPQP